MWVKGRAGTLLTALLVVGCGPPPTASSAFTNDTPASAPIATVIGWQWQSPLPLGAVYRFWGDAAGDLFALSEIDTLLVRPAGASDWLRRPAPQGAGLLDLTGSSGSDLYALGSAAVFHTTDQGQTWTSQALPQPIQSGWIVSDGATLWVATASFPLPGGSVVFRSFDGGASWDVAGSFDGFVSSGIWGSGGALLLAGGGGAGEIDEQGLIARSTDGGWTWSTNAGVAPLDLVGLYGAGMSWWAVGGDARNGGLLVRSLDGGASWRPMVMPTEQALVGVRGNAGGDLYASGSAGTVARLAPGATRWTLEPFPETDDLRALWVGPTGDVVVTSVEGRLFERAGGATTWQEEPLLPSQALARLVSTGVPDELFAVGERGTILHTTNGGDTWQPQSSGTTLPLLDAWAGAGDALVVGARGTMLRSRDGGAHWQLLPSLTDQDLGGVWSDGQGNFVVGGDGGVILTSGDGAASWTQLFVGQVKVVSAWGGSANDVYLAGFDTGTAQGVLLHGGGASWPRMVLPPRDQVPSLSSVWGTPGDVYAAGDQGAVFHSVDHGASWERLATGITEPLFGISGDGMGELFAVGGLEPDGDGDPPDSLLLHSTDGGRSWQLQRNVPLTGALDAVVESPAGDVWLTDDSGVIVRRRRAP